MGASSLRASTAPTHARYLLGLLAAELDIVRIGKRCTKGSLQMRR